MSRKHHSQWTLCLMAAMSSMALPSCADMTPTHGASAHSRTTDQRVRLVLDDIYASRKPVRFEQIDVSDIVLKHIPLGIGKDAVAATFASSRTTRVIEGTPTRLVLRDDKGRAMLDPDARSVVMTFSFDLAGKLAEVKALHFRNQ
jgi:Family of unknown function (DUF6393)